MKRRAFTLAETLIVMTILGVIGALTITSFMKSNTIKEKKIYSVSQDFYSATVRTYQQILLSKTTNADITKLLKATGATGTGDLTDFIKYIKTYMDGRDTSCSDLKLTTSSIKNYAQSATCLEFNSKVIAAYKLDLTCTTSVATRNYYDSQNKTATTTSNACGYVVYGFKDSKGVLGEDVFTIPFGKRGIK